MCKALHHEDSANILIFLAHFSDHPAIIESLLKSAQLLFQSSSPAELDVSTDLGSLKCLSTDEIKLRLPSTDPEENRKRLLEAKDEKLSSRAPEQTDGRNVSPKAPETPDDELSHFLRDIHASLKAIDILGQVLRNGVGAISAERKEVIVDEIYNLARRLVGFVVSDLPNELPRWAVSLNEHFHKCHSEDTINERLARISNHIVGVLSSITYNLSRRVSHSLAHEHLEIIFDAVLERDKCNANRLFDLSSRLDVGQGIPINKAGDLFDELIGNPICRNTVIGLVGNYLYLHRVRHDDRQQICKRLGIEYDLSDYDHAKKREKRIAKSKGAKSKRKKRR